MQTSVPLTLLEIAEARGGLGPCVGDDGPAGDAIQNSAYAGRDREFAAGLGPCVGDDGPPPPPPAFSLLDLAEERGGLGPCVGDDGPIDGTIERPESFLAFDRTSTAVRTDVSYEDGTPQQIPSLLDLATSRGGLGPCVGDDGPATDQLSDRRLKDDITEIGSTVLGLPLYRFRYKSGSTYFAGLMAQDVMAVRPEAVSTGHDGFYRLNYSVLGTEMVRL